MSSSDTQQGWEQVAAEAAKDLDAIYASAQEIGRYPHVTKAKRVAKGARQRVLATINSLAEQLTSTAAEVARLREALQDILSPVEHLERTKPAGTVLNGYAATYANSVAGLQGIARAALTRLAAGEAEGA